MIFNMNGGVGAAGSGSGAGLNFKVVGGTTQPIDPSENTIWINTDAEITGWIFSADVPDAPFEGMVWIYVGNISPVSFNALKKNGIQIYPISTKQWIGGAWVNKVAQSYRSGAWVDWITWLYNNGNECTDITGGWETQQTAAGSIKENTDNISFSLMGIPGGGSYGVANTVSKIDLTNVSQLIINSDWIVAEDNNGTRPVLGVATSKPRSAANVRSGAAMTSGSILDVSALTGSYYIYVGCAMATGNQYEVTLKVTDIGKV